jgi:hypothetical protein
LSKEEEVSNSSQTKKYGLRLTLGGAPNTPHTVVGIPGVYRPDIPTPVGGEGELSLERAKEIAESNVDLELVEVKDILTAKTQNAKDVAEARNAAAAASRDNPTSAERERLKDEIESVKGEN